MNETVAKDIVELIKSTKDFVLEQAPDVARQAVLYARVIHPIGLFVALLGLTACFYIIKVLSKKILTQEWDDIAWVPGGLGVVLALCFCVALMIDSLNEGTKAWVAPKLYLLEHFTSAGCGK